MAEIREARFGIGDIVCHRIHPFRGVIFDVDPVFSNTEEWWLSIPENMRPIKNQPYYHLLAENEKTTYVAYVSEQNLLPDETGEPLPGYTLEDAVSVDRNGIAQEVWWRGGPDLGSLAGRPVRMRVRMRSAKLYAFQFAESGR